MGEHNTLTSILQAAQSDDVKIRLHAAWRPCIDIGVHILDLTLWLMDFPEPVSVSGVAWAPLAHHEGAFTALGRIPVPTEMDVEDFAAAFARFGNGATLSLEVSWLLHHNTPREETKVWLYGTEAGCAWPEAEFYETDYATRQLQNRTLQLTKDVMEPHALACVAFARAVAEGLPSPVPAEQSLYVQAILDGIYRSQAAGHEVAISI